MSDSGKKDSGEWGTIFSQGREHSLAGLEHSRSTAWTEKDEAAYLERVQEKARQMAAGIIAEARADAERLRAEAQEHGYSTGLGEAQAELDSFRAAMADSVSAVLHAIEGQCSYIFEQWREDIVAVAKLAVERITAVELSERRQEILSGLLTEAVGLLEKRRELVIRVNPEDEPVIADIIAITKERFEDVRSWRVKGDSGISPGGMMVESESSLAEGKVESRIEAVNRILNQLTLPDMLDEHVEHGEHAGHVELAAGPHTQAAEHAAPAQPEYAPAPETYAPSQEAYAPPQPENIPLPPEEVAPAQPMPAEAAAPLATPIAPPSGE